MPKETSLRELMRTAVGITTASVVTGTVTDTDPLEICVDNDAKLILTEDNVYVPQHLTNYSVSIRIPGVGTERCTIRNALQEDDRVYLLSYDEGSLYFVLDKVG